MWAFWLCLFLAPLNTAPQTTGVHDAVKQVYETGESALKAGNLSLAKQSFLQVLSSVPDDPGARINLGVVFMRENQWDQALRYLREAAARAPGITGIQLNIGLAEYRRGNYPAAIPPFKTVLRDQPDSTQARHLLGLSYLFEEHYAEAAETLEPLWPTANSDLSYLYSLAVAAGNAKKHDVEERSLARLMEIGKDSSLVHLLNGKAYLAREDFDRALVELQLAAEGDPGLPLLHYNLGVVYRRQGRLEEARKEFLLDIAKEPGVAFNYDQLGAIAFQLQENQQAEAYFHEALRRNAALGTAWFGLAKVYKLKKLYPQALKAIERADAIDPRSASAHYLRAQILGETGRLEEAKVEMATVRKLKRESLDKLEQQVNGPAYHDPERGEHR